MPGLVYECIGSCLVLDPPSPKFHDQEVGEPVDRSVKVTSRGALPEVGEPLNSAVGSEHSLAVM